MSLPPSHWSTPVRPSHPATEAWWQRRHPSPGWAPLCRDERADVVVVGGGVTGCSSAWHLARAGANVRLLEARTVASGASGRNGGFLVAGLAHRPVPLAARVGSVRAAELFELTVRGRERLYEVAGAIGAGSYAMRTGSLRLAVDLEELAELDAEHMLLAAMGTVRVERLDAAQLPDGLGAHFLGGLRFPDDGRSVPAGWVHALASAAADAGVRLHERSPIVAIEDDAAGVVVRTDAGHEVRADHVVLATEAWLGGLAPELSGFVLPYRSQVLAASAPRHADGTVRRVLSHPTWSRRGWDYAQQTADGTIVAGGEELEDLDLVRCWDEQPVGADQTWIETWIRRVLQVEPDVLARWAGVLSQTADGFPLVGPLPGRPRVIACGGWGGAGNVLGFACGELVAELVRGTDDRIPVEMRSERIATAFVSR